MDGSMVLGGAASGDEVRAGGLACWAVATLPMHTAAAKTSAWTPLIATTIEQCSAPFLNAR